MNVTRYCIEAILVVY